MPDLSPTALQPILAHLLTWGELSSTEARRLKADEAGLALLSSAELTRAAPGAWLMGPALSHLLPGASLDEIWQKACWSLPVYQAFLSSLAAGEIARRGLEGAGELVEKWVAIEWPHHAPAFNDFLDKIELNHLHMLLIESTPGALVHAVKRRMLELEKESGLDFATWNRALLGVSAPEDAVFQAALSRGALSKPTFVSIDQEVALLPAIQDLNYELANSCGRWVFAPTLANPDPRQHPNLMQEPAWRKRRYVFSSIPLIAGTDEAKLITLEQIQSAFCQHPISWIIIQIGLYQQIQANSGASEPLRLGLERDQNNEIQDLRIEFLDGTFHLLSEILPQLISAFGMRLILPFGNMPMIAKSGLLESMFRAHILEQNGDQVVLCAEFSQAAFEAKNYQTLVKTPKPWRTRLIEVLQNA